MAHLSESEVQRFVHGNLEPEEQRRVVRHLLGGCPHCRQRLMPFSDVLFKLDEIEERAGGRVLDFYDFALDQAAAGARRYEARLRGERKQMMKALDAARSRGADDLTAEDFVCEEVRALHGWTRVEALLRLSFEERYRTRRRCSCSPTAPARRPRI